MKLYQFRIVIITAVSLTMLNACKPANQSNGPVAATVNGTAISVSSVDMVAKQSTSQGQPESPEMRKNIIEQLSMQVLLSQEAVKKGLDKNPEVSDQLDMIRHSILAKAYVQEYMKNNPVSDEMVKAEYEKIKSQLAGNEYKARHILVDKEEEARDIIKKLKANPKAFASLAKAKSKDPGSKAEGGELGWFDPRAMVPEFGAALAKLGKGQITADPVKSQFGYHVILLEDSRSRAVPSLDQVKPQLKQQILQQNLQKLFEELKAKAKIEIAQIATPSTSSSDKNSSQGENKNGAGDKPTVSGK